MKLNSTIIVAEHDNQLVGHLTVIGGSTKRIQHRAHLVISILTDYSGQGVGTRLSQLLEEWRKNTGILRLELTVMEHNERAISLYRKMGFTEEGYKKNSIMVDGKLVDELYMAKLY